MASHLTISLKKIFDKIHNNLNVKDLVVCKSHFTRRNKLTFEAVVLKILHSFNDSVEFNLATFFPQLNIPHVTAGAFSIARYKLKIDLFLDLNKELIQVAQAISPKSWKGYQLIAGDGTTVNIPVSKNTIEHFGLFRDSAKGGKTVMANACMLYDVLTNCTLAASIAPFKKGEKSLMAQLVEEASFSNPIVILDRGFCAHYFIKMLIGKEIGFCVRLRTTEHLFGQRVLANNSEDFITEWVPSEAERSTCIKKNQDVFPIKVRVTKITLPGGETEVLVSSLFDMVQFKKEDIDELYQLRWSIEEAYKKLKPKMKLEQFGCKKQEGIYQEFYSHIFMMNLTTLIGTQAQELIVEKLPKRKYEYRYNWNNAYKFIQHSFLRLFKLGDLECVIIEIIKKIASSVVAIVPHRKFVRQTNSIKKHRFSPIYK